MSLRWYSVVMDCHDIAAQSRWWADVGQVVAGANNATWLVLAEPEGNDFCALSSRSTQ